MWRRQVTATHPPLWAAYYSASNKKMNLGKKRAGGIWVTIVGVWPDNIFYDIDNTEVIGYHHEIILGNLRFLLVLS